MTDQAEFYQTGGSLTHDAPSYVARDADRQLLDALLRGEFCYVLTSRQMGKSSLMVHTTQRLRQQGVHVVVMDLTAIGENLTAEQWYLGLLGVMGRRLDLEEELEEFWWEHERLGPLERWMRALREVVLPRIGAQCPVPGAQLDPKGGAATVPCPTGAGHWAPGTGHLVVFIDEIDTVRSLPFSTDEFFAAIRECYNRRTEDAEYRRLTFCLLGVATPSDLIRDVRRTPFNIGRRIDLNDFSEGEAVPLAIGLGPWGSGEPGGDRQDPALKAQYPHPDAQRLLQRILYWTGGHPYLTQRLCQAVAEANTACALARATASNPKSKISNPKSVDRLCEELFLSSRGRERDDNLLFVRDRMLGSDGDLASLLDLYGQVRCGKRVPVDDTNELVDLLRLSGITRIAGVRRQASGVSSAGGLRRLGRWHLSWPFTDVLRLTPDACLVVRNRIYARVFDRRWVAQHMPDAELRRQRAAYRRGLMRATAVSTVVLTVMAWLAFTAMNQTRRAQEGQQTLRRTLYVAQTNMAQQAWEDGNVGRAVELLNAQRPTRPGREDLRGFEWRYLWRLCQGDSRFTFRGHTDQVRCVAFSPNGRLLATASRDSTVKLWDMTSRWEMATLTGHMGGVLAAAFSPDGTLLASASGDGVVKLWNTATQREVRTLKGHRDAVGSVAFSPNGKLLATASDDRTVKLWNVATGRELTTFPGPRRVFLIGRELQSVAFSPDGKILASGRQDGSVKLWDIATRQPVASLSGPDVIASVAFSPDGKLLASGDSNRTVRLWDVARRRELAVFKPFKGIVHVVAFSHDGKILAAGSMEGTIKLWDVGSATRGRGRRKAWETGPPPAARYPAREAGGRSQGAGVLANAKSAASEYAREITTLKGHTDEVWSVAFSPDGKMLASASSDHTARLWEARGASDVGAGAPQGVGPVPDPRPKSAILQGHQGRVVNTAFSPDGKILAAASLDGTVKLWDVARTRVMATLRGHTQAMASAVFSPDGNFLATGTGSRLAPERPGEVKLWTVPSAKSAASEHAREITTLKAHRGGIFGAAFSPDGRTLATASLDGTVKLWNVAAGKLVVTLSGHQRGADGVAFSPDGRTLATSGLDGNVKLWEAGGASEADSGGGRAPGARRGGPAAGAWRERITWKGHTLQVRSVAFSPDGKTLATASFDRTVKLWDVRGAFHHQGPTEIATLKGHSDRVSSAVFAPDGKTLASGSFDGTVKLWNLLTKQEVATLRGHTDRVLRVVFSPDGDLLASASNDSTVRLWRAAPFTETDAGVRSQP